ncbi:hypothetical protein CGJ25_24355 [Vibrio parahaemolyticus]|nr:hypothetical protein CGK19_24125 [Vibrio parahaemolyticus]TOF27424.1 hypothetical protein CGJ25_24355 [Vibrio parahaemolyticus]
MREHRYCVAHTLTGRYVHKQEIRMAILDFKEIPMPHKGGGEQDKFELFARDFFHNLGYKIESAPGRGADGGKDLLLIETRKGIANDTEVRWLVSCKHKAHSGSSVSKTDEPEILDSLRAHGCDGFIGFYSTLPSSGLVAKVESITEIEHQFFDSSKIEQTLLKNSSCLELAKRYFPVSYKSWADENPKPAQIFSDFEPFKCHSCGEELGYESIGRVVSWSKYETVNDVAIKKIRNQYVCCGGDCDYKLSHSARYFTDGYVDAWADLKDYFTPTLYLRAVMGFCNELNDPTIEYSAEAFDQEKEILLKAFPYVCRNLTKSEVDQIRDLAMLPKFLGGLG